MARFALKMKNGNGFYFRYVTILTCLKNEKLKFGELRTITYKKIHFQVRKCIFTRAEYVGNKNYKKRKVRYDTGTAKNQNSNCI